MNTIETLMKKYLDGLTSLQEESLLAEMIDRSENVTEEQKVIAAMLRRGGYYCDEAQEWLDEDETDTYDRIVKARRHRIRTIRRWAVAASVALIIGAVSWLMNVQRETETGMLAIQSMDYETVIKMALPTDSMTGDKETALAIPQQQVESRQKPRQEKPSHDLSEIKEIPEQEGERMKETIGAIQARLEMIGDSVSRENAKIVIATDAQLSRIVNSM